MLLGFWPFAAWRKILLREPNVKPQYLKRHKRMTLALGVIFAVVLSVAITFGAQNGDDRRRVDAIEQGKQEFGAVAAKIGSIKSRELKSTADYINAYSEIEPLLNDFDERLTKLSATFKEAQNADEHRGPLNIQRLYRHRDTQLFWDVQVLQLLREDTDVTRRQIQVTKEMATLPDGNQVEFWNANFLPF